MTPTSAELLRIASDQRRLNEEQIRLHALEMQQAGRSLVHSSPITDWRLALSRRGNRYTGDERNIMHALRLAPELAGLLRFNEFAERVETTRPTPWNPGEHSVAWTDRDDTALKVWLQERDIDCRSTNAIAETVYLVSTEKRWHPLRNRLLTLKWDGQDRLCGWLRDYLNATDDERYLAAVGKAWMIGAIARVVSPGAQVDHALVLTGPQGAGKTQAARTLALDNEYFLGEVPDLRNKDTFLVLRGKWIVELAELAAVRKAETEAVKSFITQQSDTYRPPYARRSITVPRQCSFIATTNERCFLRDRTGNRRWWPISVRRVETDLLRRDVEQLWAEAVYLFRSGHLWHLTGADVELAEAIQSERVEMTEIDSMVADYLAHLSVDSISTRDVLINALNLDPTSSTFAEQAQRLGTKVNSAISSAGWEYLGRKGKHRLTMYSRRIRQG